MFFTSGLSFLSPPFVWTVPQFHSALSVLVLRRHQTIYLECLASATKNARTLALLTLYSLERNVSEPSKGADTIALPLSIANWTAEVPLHLHVWIVFLV